MGGTNIRQGKTVCLLEFISFSGDVKCDNLPTNIISTLNHHETPLTLKRLIVVKDSVSSLLRKVEQRLHLSKVTNAWSCCNLQALPHIPGFAFSAAAMAVAVSPAVLLVLQVVVSSLMLGGVLSHSGKSDGCVQILIDIL